MDLFFLINFNLLIIHSWNGSLKDELGLLITSIPS